jgi:hypothetical protein
MPIADTTPRATPVTATPSVVATLLPIVTAVSGRGVTPTRMAASVLSWSKVYEPDIAARRDTLYKEPGYALF